MLSRDAYRCVGVEERKRKEKENVRCIARNPDVNEKSKRNKRAANTASVVESRGKTRPKRGEECRRPTSKGKICPRRSQAQGGRGRHERGQTAKHGPLATHPQVIKARRDNEPHVSSHPHTYSDPPYPPYTPPPPPRRAPKTTSSAHSQT